jgi:signal transduction histidine kinase
MSKLFRIPVLFLVTGILWGLLSDPVITLFFSHLAPGHLDLFRSLNDFAFVIIISIVLYIEIGNQQRKLQEANQKIIKRNEILLNVTWSNSHELRKPLCSMLSLVSLLKETTDEQERKEYILLLQQSTIEMDEITQKNNIELNAIRVNN